MGHVSELTPTGGGLEGVYTLRGPYLDPLRIGAGGRVEREDLHPGLLAAEPLSHAAAWAPHMLAHVVLRARALPHLQACGAFHTPLGIFLALFIIYGERLPHRPWIKGS